MSQLPAASANHQPVELDIAIVGAGLVGLPLAVALAAQGWRVGLLDAGKAEPTADSSTTDASNGNDTDIKLAQRCTALSLGTQQWFAETGLWQHVAQDACCINKVNVSHKGFFGATRLNAAELGVPAVGYVVNNAEFTRQQQRNLKHTSVQYYNDARVLSVESYSDSVVLLTHSGDRYRARLLIAADGIGSVVRESAGIAVKQVDYEQSAVLGMVRLAGQHNGAAHERFTPSGPLAMLPRPGPYMSFVDCIDPASREAIEKMSRTEYLQRLQTRFGFRLGRFTAVGSRFVTPLMRIEADSQIAHRTILLGNAMRLLHPVGGQGYNLAMRDVAQLVALLNVRDNTDPGNDARLAQFVSLRTTDQQRVVQFTDLLARGFRGSAALPGHMRSVALLGLDMVSPLRREFASRTMGQLAGE